MSVLRKLCRTLGAQTLMDDLLCVWYRRELGLGVGDFQMDSEEEVN
jgi:hypothetical protein